ncbi:MAG: BNR repeat-containing protein [Planctomycetota bacterium]
MFERRIISVFICYCILSACMAFSIADEIQINKIPVAKGLASHPVNGGRCLISDGKYQYIAFYDGDHNMTVGKRKLNETKWDFAKLPERVGWDTHNRVVLFRDQKGYLHITGNMHCVPLRYYRTKEPANIHTFQPIHKWTGDYEERVTYPSILKLHDGSIYMMYRHGGSGNGMRILLHYNEDTQKWIKTVPSLTNGRDRNPTCNAYPFGVVAADSAGKIPKSGILADSDGLWHIAWCWRETPDVITNFDICYAKSPDHGVSWKGWDGTDLKLPITPENAYVVENIEQKSGLLNGGSLAVDGRGQPYISYTRFDKDGNNQIYIATPVEKKWKIIQLTDWKHRFYFQGRGTIPQNPPVPRVSITNDNKILVTYSYKYANPKKGQLFLTRKQLLTSKPGQYPFQKAKAAHSGIPNIRAVNHGPLPKGYIHYMQQATDSPNRDRKPQDPRDPTMIYVVEVKNKQ